MKASMFEVDYCIFSKIIITISVIYCFIERAMLYYMAICMLEAHDIIHGIV